MSVRDVARGPNRRAARLDRLRALVLRSGPLRLSQAASLLAVSSMTVRRDLEEEECGLLLLGGHVAMSPGANGSGAPYVFERERDRHAEAKREAGRRAAALVADGDTIFVDCGTTMPYLLSALSERRDVTIVCYALNVAALACARPGARVVVLGGVFYASSETFMSEEAVCSIRRIGLNKAFLSAGGLHETFGATCSHFHEVPIKQAAMARAVRSFLVIDRSKIGQVRPAAFAAADAFDDVLTEASS